MHLRVKAVDRDRARSQSNFDRSIDDLDLQMHSRIDWSVSSAKRAWAVLQSALQLGQSGLRYFFREIDRSPHRAQIFEGPSLSKTPTRKCKAGSIIFLVRFFCLLACFGLDPAPCFACRFVCTQLSFFFLLFLGVSVSFASLLLLRCVALLCAAHRFRVVCEPKTASPFA